MASDVAQPSPSHAPDTRFEPGLPLDRISPSKTNPRRVFEDMDRLIASVKASGVLSPILVRPIRSKLSTNRAQDLVVESLGLDPDARYELVFGERRYRAAKAAGLKTIPAMVRSLTDAQVIEDQIIENNQRKDIHPLDEADGALALKKLGMDDATIAAKLGWSEGYTAKRLRLSHLAPVWRQIWSKGEIPMGLGAAYEISRLSESQQLTLHAKIKHDLAHAITHLDYLRRHIFDLFQRNLADAPWKLDDINLSPAAGACNACPNNTKYQAALFDDVKGALCLKPECFAAKQERYVALTISALKEKGSEPVMISTAYGKERPKGALGRYDVQEISKAEAKKLPAAQVKEAVIVDGEDAGKTMTVRVTSGGSTSVPRVTDAQRKAEEKAKRDQAFNHAVLDAVLKSADSLGVMSQRIIAIESFKRLSGDDQKRLIKRYGWQKPAKAGFGDHWMLMLAGRHVESLAGQDIASFALECSLLPLCYVNANWGSDNTKKLRKIAEQLGIDLDKVRENFNAAQEKSAASKPNAKRKRGRK